MVDQCCLKGANERADLPAAFVGALQLVLS